MKRLNTGLTAVIGIDGHFEPRDTDSEPAFQYQIKIMKLLLKTYFVFSRAPRR